MVPLAACKNNAAYKVVFWVDGSVYDTVVADDGGYVRLPEDPEKPGYSFEGWYYAEDLQVRFDANSTVTGDMIVHAIWAVLPDCTPGLLFTPIGSTAYSVSMGTATAVNVVIPETFADKPVTEVAEEGFFTYTALKNVSIPSSVKNIGDCAFYNCVNFTSVYYGADATAWDGISIGSDGDSLTSLSRYFYSETAQEGCWRYVDGVPTLW